MNPTSLPPITPQQMNILRAVTAMAWADGILEPAEVNVLASQLSRAFAGDPTEQETLSQSLKEYLSQRIPMEEVLPKIRDFQAQRLILKLGYLVIAASARTPDEPLINVQEAEAFTKLVNYLDLPAEVVHEVSEEARQELPTNSDVAPIEALVAGFTRHFQSV
jgi:uncharacterized membrane protein YebE (DUF533 family)